MRRNNGENLFHIHSESKKLCHYTFIYNFGKCWPIFKILLLLYSPRNLQQNRCQTCRCTTLQNVKERNLQHAVAFNTITLA